MGMGVALASPKRGVVLLFPMLSSLAATVAYGAYTEGRSLAGGTVWRFSLQGFSKHSLNGGFH